jgi:hypothetical protein
MHLIDTVRITKKTSLNENNFVVRSNNQTVNNLSYSIKERKTESLNNAQNANIVNVTGRLGLIELAH